MHCSRSLALWILILCCDIVRMCCVLEDFLVFLLSFVFLFGLECDCDHGCEGFTHPSGKGREVQGEWVVVGFA